MSSKPYKFCPMCASALVIRRQMGENRPTCPNCGWVHYEDPKVAAGVLAVIDRRILLVRRVMDPYAGMWSIPAGFVNAYEDPAQAAVRECREETGLVVELAGLLDMITGREHPRGADIFLVYQARKVSGLISAADDADKADWFDLEKLPDLAFESTRKVIAKILPQ